MTSLKVWVSSQRSCRRTTSRAKSWIARQPTESLAFNEQLTMNPYRLELLAANERECEGLRQRGRTSEPREAIRALGREQDAMRKRKNSKI